MHITDQIIENIYGHIKGINSALNNLLGAEHTKTDAQRGMIMDTLEDLATMENGFHEVKRAFE